MATAAAAHRILVTGANKGIGRAIVEKLAARNDVEKVFLGSRDEARGKAAADAIASNKVAVLSLDVTSEESVRHAAEEAGELTAIVNNAGVGFGRPVEETVDVNFFGTKRCCEAFQVSDRIVNIASASGPNYLSRCGDAIRVNALTNPNVSLEEILRICEEGLDDVGEAYGFSKALINAYTRWLSNASPNLVVNSCTPGYILTDLTAGMGATNPPEMGTVAPLSLLFRDASELGGGYYYGSDGLRSPLDKYREPGSPPYEGP